MLLPAIQQARETARRASCMSRLSQIGMALNGYHLAHRHYPSGSVNNSGPITNVPIGFHHSWMVAILPFIDENLVFRNVDHASSIYAPSNLKIRTHRMGLFSCPSDPAHGPYSNYAGIHHSSETAIDRDNNGTLFLNSRIRSDDIEDGSSHTIIVSEKRVEQADLGWSSGTRSSLRNMGFIAKTIAGAPKAWTMGSPVPPGIVTKNGGSSVTHQPAVSKVPPELWIDQAAIPLFSGAQSVAVSVGPIGSYHFSGVNILMADGSTEFVADGIDQHVRSCLGNRNDGNLLPPLESL